MQQDVRRLSDWLYNRKNPLSVALCYVDPPQEGRKDLIISSLTYECLRKHGGTEGVSADLCFRTENADGSIDAEHNLNMTATLKVIKKYKDGSMDVQFDNLAYDHNYL